MPYISASIFMQLATILVPQLQKIQKEGESGRKKINQWTRYLTVIVTIFQASAYVQYLKTPGYAEALIPAYQPVSSFYGNCTYRRYFIRNVAWRKNTGQRLRQRYFNHYHDWYPGSFAAGIGTGV